MGRKGTYAVVVAVVLAAVLGVAIAASRGRNGTRPHVTKPPASKQFGDDADLMRRLERSKHVHGSQ